MIDDSDNIRPCPACGTMSIHEAFCAISWAHMGRLYRETQEKLKRDSESKDAN